MWIAGWLTFVNLSSGPWAVSIDHDASARDTLLVAIPSDCRRLERGRLMDTDRPSPESLGGNHWATSCPQA